MSGIKSLSGGMVDVNKLDTVLGSMGMSLTEEELKDLTQNLPENVDRKVDLKQVMDAVKSFTGEKVDINNLENLLRNMGIELADTEYTKLVKARPLSGTAARRNTVCQDSRAGCSKPCSPSQGGQIQWSSSTDSSAIPMRQDPDGPCRKQSITLKELDVPLGLFFPPEKL
ncbi:uncharacterized protein LOC102154635 isoform X3 [Canis lupus familiaris]|uniref:uncharacterized protein LOC102154635 isoform X3 n=1 Tax=Canis lupus familiaris TaxID=9615 RepID=UPI000BAA0CDD|nr:uncharacterized protein LOC102154635 isoform X3 [Canis lupus familiaris]|eukprot:XP_022278504.1 uncharacterized protein LOC102154635 isoform X2 [Canis lupus familiaris]